MGVNFKDLVVKKEVSISELSNKILVVDGNNILYQFLSSIRQPDGTPLMDSEGRITSHLTGLFHRSTKLMQQGLKLVFVFDGKPPELKKEESLRRAGLKDAARKQFEAAKQDGDISGMKKFAQRTSRLTKDMIREAADLLGAMGVPVVQAPSEGEAQAAYMVRKGDAYAEISQDYDCLLFAVPRMIQNLTISERKKKKDRLSYETVKPQLIELEPNLKHMGVTQDQLIALGMLVGTDFNVGGIKGIGPKKAFDLIKKHQDDLDNLFLDVDWDSHFSHSWQEVFNLFKKMPVMKDYSLKWQDFNMNSVFDILCDKHGFSRDRVNDTLERLSRAQEVMSQKGLSEFF